ncbi:MAG TPA: type II toxin-antitoxin system HicA family toxin [Dehalococcoidia bacterium]|nr:type II toxin-antitoxin system HicA family toxin [Dehalococcoidia bacterium]
MTSSRLLRSVGQDQVVRALVRAGGVLDSKAGKGSHVRVTMPSMRRVFVPSGTLKTGTLAAIINQSGLTRAEFIALL